MGVKVEQPEREFGRHYARSSSDPPPPCGLDGPSGTIQPPRYGGDLRGKTAPVFALLGRSELALSWAACSLTRSPRSGCEAALRAARARLLFGNSSPLAR